MSTLAKVFVVINLFLALAFVGVSAAFLGEKENWRNIANNRADELAATESVLSARAARLENEKEDQVRLYAALHERYTETLKLWENTRLENKNYVDRQAELETRLSGLDQSFKEIQGQIEREREENTRLTASVRAADDERDEARNAQREAEEMWQAVVTELEVAEDRLRGLGEEIAQKTRKLEDADVRNRYLTETGGTQTGHNPVAPPPIDGRLTAVSADVNLVMLNVGKDDRVETGHVFTVYRGDTYVAKVQVKDVFKDSSSAVIIPAYKKFAPREGDNVSTRIY